MILLEWYWNHANLTGPRPIEGFCRVDPPTQILWYDDTCFKWAGTYITGYDPLLPKESDE